MDSVGKREGPAWTWEVEEAEAVVGGGFQEREYGVDLWISFFLLQETVFYRNKNSYRSILQTFHWVHVC